MKNDWKKRSITQLLQKLFSETNVYLLTAFQLERYETWYKFLEIFWRGFFSGKNLCQWKTVQCKNFFLLSIVEICKTKLFYLINSLNPGFIIHKGFHSLKKKANKIYIYVFIYGYFIHSPTSLSAIEEDLSLHLYKYMFLYYHKI